MSVRLILAGLQDLGGEADLEQLRAIHYLASARLSTLIRQGLVERTGPAHYRLLAPGKHSRDDLRRALH